MACSVVELASQIEAEIVGGSDVEITHVADIDSAQVGSLSFAASSQYKNKLKNTQASAVIVPPDLVPFCKVVALVSENPYLCFARATQILYPPAPIKAGIHASAVVSEQCKIAEDVGIGPNVVIDADCQIGSGSYIGPGTVITAPCSIGENVRLLANVSLVGPTEIGDRVLIHPGVVIGSDGFGLANNQGVWEKIPQIGRVLIGADVEIGANTTIDRGALQDTVIEQGVKLDNQIQVAHNVKIGAHTAIAGCTGIAGSAVIGKHCGIGGGAGIQGHIEITDGVQVTGMTKISQSIEKPGVYTSGTAAQDNKEWIRNALRFKELDDLAKRLRRLEKISKA